MPCRCFGAARYPPMRSRSLPTSSLAAPPSTANRYSDGTVIAAHVDGGGVSKAVIDGGFYKLLVEQPLGESFAGKIVLFTIGD